MSLPSYNLEGVPVPVISLDELARYGVSINPFILWSRYCGRHADNEYVTIWLPDPKTYSFVEVKVKASGQKEDNSYIAGSSLAFMQAIPCLYVESAFAEGLLAFR